MGNRAKLKRYAELATFPNVYLQPEDLRGMWNSRCFDNAGAITLELGCGRGEYTRALALLHPQRNFIGVDIKGGRLWQAARSALMRRQQNVAFARFRIEFITDVFAENEVDEIWITFPDPFPKNSKGNRRLTAGHFITKYRRILRPGGRIHLKTDSDLLYAFTLESLTQESCTLIHDVPDLYTWPIRETELTIQTRFEEMHLAEGRTIKYICFAP